jgi:small-conductance mechanosensitive channel
MKLELRLPYDAEIEKVRKIIKKVGQQILEHPEMGPSVILPLKSQGVMRVEESALIVRMKLPRLLPLLFGVIASEALKQQKMDTDDEI